MNTDEHPTVILLPTHNVIGQCLIMAQEIQYHDYDLDFYVEEVMRALDPITRYPDSYMTDIHLTVENMDHLEHMSENDRLVLNRMREFLYHTIHQALVLVGAYSVSGHLDYKFSAVHRGDVMVSIHPLHVNLSDAYDQYYL